MASPLFYGRSHITVYGNFTACKGGAVHELFKVQA